MWLLNRLFTHNDQPKPRFAFQGTVNWMRALSLLTATNFSNAELRQFYQPVQRRVANEEADTLAFECLTMAMHDVSAIKHMEEIDNPYAIVRSAIIAWYYSTYYAAKAMIAASSGANPQTHASAGRIWQAELVANQLVKSPFDLSITDITPAHVAQAILALRAGNTNDLNLEPTNHAMAFGACLSYLKGTAEYEQWRLEEMVKESATFRNGGFTDFRTNAARALRDARLRPALVNFLVQAFRYRGKANYRDAIYLSYGRDESARLRRFISDLRSVGEAFSLMAAHYVAKRVVRNDWDLFAADIVGFARFELPFPIEQV